MTNKRILVLDIETAPITAYVWGLFDQNIGLSQIKEDWTILAWAAKWLGEPESKLIYQDNRNGNVKNDKRLVKGLASLIEQADSLISQNGIKFDLKKLRSRAIIHGLPPIKQVPHTDLLREGKKVFSFTSHKLDYLTDTLNTKYKKLKHEEYPGFELWKAILKGNAHAWKVMQKYCSHDVLSTEESYVRMQDWIKNPAVYGKEKCRHCGNTSFRSEGTRVTATEVYKRLYCKTCHKPRKGSVE